MTDKTLVFLDTETSGLDPHVHEIIEVAMIVRQPPVESGLIVDRVEHFALQFSLSRADKKALEVNRYHEREDELVALTISDARAGAKLAVQLSGAVVIGNNPQFDLRFIEHFLRTRTMANSTPWYYHPVDLKALVAGRLGLGEPPWSTSQIAEESGVPLPDGYHSALVDAQWNRDVYDAVMRPPVRLPSGAVNPLRWEAR